MEESKEEKKAEEKEVKKEISLKEQRIRKIALSYYSRSDVRKAMFEFSKNRECIPRYFEGFGKRPDAFHYESDILELAKKGATSFHCSEELWQDPLQLSLEMTEEEQKKLRQGWDLLIDVDAKYFDYSKIYAEILIKTLNNHGVKNIGIKFSGSKGWHIIIPWKAFPEEMSGMKTKEMFPTWPRLICKYLQSKIQEELREKIIDIPGKELETYCVQCGNTVNKTNIITLQCTSCHTKSETLEEVLKRKRILRCSMCEKELKEVRREEVLFCENCSINSKKNPLNFKERVQSRHIDADIVLVSPRHLFRMPYSLHEKTSLASVVISPEKIKDFELRDADPLRVKPINFIPDSEPGEATFLLRESLEHQVPEGIEKKQEKDKNREKNGKFKELTITNLSSETYPPAIKKILEGIKSDGRKRALFILLNFFKSLKLSDEQIKQDIEEWDKKNYKPLQQGYIKSQLSWYAKQKPKLPPNYDKPFYKEIGIVPTQEEIKAKNPVNYTVKKYFALNKTNQTSQEYGRKKRSNENKAKVF